MWESKLQLYNWQINFWVELNLIEFNSFDTNKGHFRLQLSLINSVPEKLVSNIFLICLSGVRSAIQFFRTKLSTLISISSPSKLTFKVFSNTFTPDTLHFLRILEPRQSISLLTKPRLCFEGLVIITRVTSWIQYTGNNSVDQYYDYRIDRTTLHFQDTCHDIHCSPS